MRKFTIETFATHRIRNQEPITWIIFQVNDAKFSYGFRVTHLSQAVQAFHWLESYRGGGNLPPGGE